MNVQLKPAQSISSTRDIMGVAVTAATSSDAIAEIDARLDAGDRVKLAFLNAHGSNLAARDPAFRQALAGMTVLNDGIGVDIASRVLHGASFPDNLNGTDFVPRYLAETKRNARIYLLGSPVGVAEEAAAKLAERFPRHTIVGTHHGFFTDAEAPSVAAAVAATRPDIVLLALGNPRQEIFIDRYFAAMDCKMAMAIGALLDFIAGRVQRAPSFLRKARLEWTFRLLQEPRRLWRRYLLGNSQFLRRLLWTRLSRAGGR